jgi:phosphoribosylaminoimidazolecarboxamide formyltransferase/IMP cyclohydrolase
MIRVRRALLSVYDKEGLLPLARRLAALGIEILASGGTAKTLEEGGVPVQRLENLTGFGQLFGGRLKTLTPQVHGGILLRRDNEDDVREAEQHEIRPIDLVVVDLYPYESGLAGGKSDVELIDIGGPALLRAAAKNHADVVSLCSRTDYDRVAEMIETAGGVPLHVSLELARKVYSVTAAYDATIASTLGKSRDEPLFRAGDERVAWAGGRARELRYGENPGQEAALYTPRSSLWETLQVHQGKDLSFNNLLDLVRGVTLMREFAGEERAVATVLKHGIPAGTAAADGVDEALERAWNGDSLSAFGGIILLNRRGNEACARFLVDLFFEAVVAPSWSPEALEVLSGKRRRIVLTWDLLGSPWKPPLPDVRWALDGLLVQSEPSSPPPFAEWKQVAGDPVDERVREDLEFSWKVIRHVRSNAIILVRDRMTVGVGAGQTSRIDALDAAILKARRSGHELEGTVLASDAFFPFPDVVERSAEVGVRAMVQPGGSVRDKDSIGACQKHGIPLFFNGQRVFIHG